MLLFSKQNKNFLYDMYVYVSVYKEKSGKTHRRYQHYLPIGEKQWSNFQLELQSDYLTVVVGIFIGPCRKK